MSAREIDAGRLVLRPVGREAAQALTDGRIPPDVAFAPGYPSAFSLEVMELVVAAGADYDSRTGPFFMVRKQDEAVVGEIGANLDAASGTAQVGYTVVESCWNHGYATEALVALLTHLRTEPGVRRVIAETYPDHHASRRVMEKAGMRLVDRRPGEVDGATVELVVYQGD